MGLLRRNAKDRMAFEVFFNHPFLQRPQTPESPSMYSVFKHFNLTRFVGKYFNQLRLIMWRKQ